MWQLPLYLVFILGCVLIAFYAERKLSAFIQDRMGPTHVGPVGLLQAVADLLKLIQKEEIIALGVKKWLFRIAPTFIFIVIFLGFAVVPLAADFQGIAMSNGLFFVIAVTSLDVLGLLMAGIASNNKFSLISAFRSIAQIISYEIPLGISILCVLMVSQTLDLQEICLQQGIFSTQESPLFGIDALGVNTQTIGGFLSWNIIQSPLLLLVYIIFFIATLAESNRAPFDIAEAESELVAGFHVEYSGFRFAIFFLAEYAMMILVSLLGAILFFGGWNTPLPNIGSFAMADWTSGEAGSGIAIFWGILWMSLKVIITLLVQVWIRWTYPRLRMDQLMNLCWKYLIPFSAVLLLGTALWQLL